MANSPKCHCCGHDQNDIRVQLLTLEDGRRAERHSFIDENGNEVVEIFSEEKRPLKLESRIVKEHKQIVAKETHQTIQDGNVVAQEVIATGEEVPLRTVEKLGVAEHAKVVEGDYVRKDEIEKVVSDAVLTGMKALLDAWEPQEPAEGQPHVPPPVGAQAIVEKNVAEKKASDSTWIIAGAVIVIAQLAFLAYMFLT